MKYTLLALYHYQIRTLPLWGMILCSLSSFGKQVPLPPISVQDSDEQVQGNGPVIVYTKEKEEERKVVNLKKGLVGHWALDGNTRDSSGNGLHGRA